MTNTLSLTVSNAERVALGFLYASEAGWQAGDLASLEALAAGFEAFALAELEIRNGWAPPPGFDPAATRDVELPAGTAALLVQLWPPRAVPAVLGPAKLALLRKLKGDAA